MDAFNRRDRAAFVALCHPSIEAVPAKDFPENAPIRGAEAVWDFIVGVNDVWDDEGSWAGRSRPLPSEIRRSGRQPIPRRKSPGPHPETGRRG